MNAEIKNKIVSQVGLEVNDGTIKDMTWAKICKPEIYQEMVKALDKLSDIVLIVANKDFQSREFNSENETMIRELARNYYQQNSGWPCLIGEAEKMLGPNAELNKKALH